MTARGYAITGPSGTRCGVYPGPSPLDAMAHDAGFASLAEWSAATGTAPERMRVTPVPERGELCILPGGLLGRVEGHAPEGRGILRVSRWSVDGWRYFGLARESTLTVEGVEAHPHYSAALAATPTATETDR